MKMIYFTTLLFYVYYSAMSTVYGQSCQKLTQLSGEIYESYVSNHYYYRYLKCWFIEVPQNSFLRLEFKELSLGSHSCSSVNVKIFLSGANETYMFCYEDNNRKPIIALNDVNVTYNHYSTNNSSFRLQFTTENFICAQKNHFRCSSNFCIHKYQVCNGIKDCENGADEIGCEKGIMAVKGVNVSRINAINWLKNQRTQSFGWGKNTHRAVTALYLAKAMTFQSNNLEEELIAKQLELQTSVALLRNASDSISISELSMFINALTVTCHNPRNFYGYNLLQILSDRVALTKSPLPSAYLTLCNLNWTLSNGEVKNLVNLLHKNSKYPFHLDVRALTVMAVTCIMNKTNALKNIVHVENFYESAVRNLSRQLPDGSFGNVYTTALVTQALMASGQEQSKEWNATATALYLMKQLNSTSLDFLSVYLILPIFSGRSLADIKTVDCSHKRKKEENDKDISEVTDKLGGKIRIQYSLYIGDEKDVIHTMYLRMPDNSSAYDVMRLAQVADSKYRFLHRDASGQMYIYEIAGIINDPEAGKFWLLYTGGNNVNGTIEHHTESPDRFILGDNDHLIMWYRTAHI